MEPDKLREMDRNHIWHPYTDIDLFETMDFPIIKRTEGNYLYDVHEKAYLDGIASWWCVNLGHGHARLKQALKEQIDTIQHVILAGMSHEKIILLAQQLAEITPAGLNHCCFAGDGSSAVEAALRISLQYWKNIGETHRNRFISLQDGYHGDTLGAVGVGYVDAFHHPIKTVIQDNYRACSPHCAQCPFQKHPDTCDVECFSDMEQLLKSHHESVAAVIVEPLCQGAAGIRIYPGEYLKRLRAMCTRYEIPLIADEIAVGFGRTGSMFACQKAGISPDIMTIGKGLTGGYLPMSAVIVTDTIYNSFRNGNTFYHGHTYSGNPIVAALALEAICVYKEERVIEQMPPLIDIMKVRMEHLSKCFPHSFHRTLGIIGMIEIHELDGGIQQAKTISQKAQQLGLLIRPLGPVIYLWPPLNMAPNDLHDMLDRLEQSVNQVVNH